MKKNQQGSAMVMVLCVMAVLLALSVAAIASAGSLMGGAVRTARAEQCRLSATTFSKVIQGQLNTADQTELKQALQEQIEGVIWTSTAEGATRKNWLELPVSGMDETQSGQIQLRAYYTEQDSAAGTITAELYLVVVDVECTLYNETYSIRNRYSVSPSEEDQWTWTLMGGAK